jgi:serine/threonine-protein kinase
VTAVGLAVGTPEYMSPEQAAGERDLGVASDVYALACVVYEMLAGEPPLRGAGARATMAKHVTETPLRVRARRAEVPPGIDDALARALAKDPAQRFPSVAAFTAALRAGAAPAARPVSAAARGVAVLPFVNASPDPDNEFLSDGITDELIVALAKVEGLRVASRTSVFALKGRPQDARAVGALLDCGVVLEGTVRRAGARVRVTAQLTSTDDGRLVWSERYDRTLDDVLAIQDEIARTIVDTLRATSFADLAPPPRRHTGNVRAYTLYLRGRFEWNRRTPESMAAAVRYFEQAIAEDPGYALAYTGLADCYALEMDYRSIPVAEGFERAKAAARRALELDDALAEAHASLAWCLFIYDWDWDGAEREFRRAIACDARYAVAHQWYAFLLVMRGALADALVEGHTAVELDAGSVSARRSLGWLYYYARRFDQARHHLERAMAMDPNAEETYRVLGLVLALQGELPEAERVLRQATAMPGAGTYTQATLGYALARAGDDRAARALLAELEARAAAGYVSPVALATIHVGLGDAERAIDAAERALADRRGWLVYLHVNPLLDPLRGHARFEALVRRMGV